MPISSHAIKSTALIAVAILGLGLLSGCATTSYGQGFKPDEQVANQYTLKVYLSAFSTAEKADQQANSEMAEFAAKNNLGAGTIVNRRYNVFPEYYEYTVSFAPRQ
jgi:uncharacterized lipoprotein YajG